MSKVGKPVRFGAALKLRQAWLSDRCPDYRAAPEYSLAASISHHGKGMHSGHYTADVRQADGRWLRFDDAEVRAVPLSQVLHDRAYLLFYQRAK